MATAKTDDKIRCEACPIRCRIAEGRTGACDRYANYDGVLTRVDPVVLLERQGEDGAVVPFSAKEWQGDLLTDRYEITGVGAGTTYPDYKPAPFIVGTEQDGVDVVTVVTEGIFSYCGVKVKIDTDRHIGAEKATVRAGDGAEVGHVTTAEYGSQMLALGGVHHLTGQGRKNGVATCDTMLALCSGEPVELEVEGGSQLVVQAGQAPIIDGDVEQRMRVGCGSATVGMFAQRWANLVDEVVVLDEHITGVMSEHQAGAVLGVQPTGIRLQGRKSTPGRYFEVSDPGSGWGGTRLSDPLEALKPFNDKHARPGLTLLMTSTTGDHRAYYVLDEELRPVERDMPEDLARTVDLIQENCEPALTSVLFMAGAGGSLRAGTTSNPVQLTRSIRETFTRVTCGGAPVYVWPGGGITFMVDVTRMPANAFGSVPTPALVAPIEFTMRLDDYESLGGHVGAVRRLDELLAETSLGRWTPPPDENAREE